MADCSHVGNLRTSERAAVLVKRDGYWLRQHGAAVPVFRSKLDGVLRRYGYGMASTYDVDHPAACASSAAVASRRARRRGLCKRHGLQVAIDDMFMDILLDGAPDR